MKTKPVSKLRLCLVAAVSVFAIACSDSSDRKDPVDPPVQPPEPELTYQAEVVWTEYGIPHVIADDWGSLGYGVGYAYARDNYCTLMREYVNAAGESARYLGDDGDINKDFVFKLFNNDERIQSLFDSLPETLQDNFTGYAAGVNRYFNETGADNLAEGDEGCRGAEWVREVDYMDVTRLLHKTILRASSDPLSPFSTSVTPPEETMASARPSATPAELETMLAGYDAGELRDAMGLPEGWEIGSNAYAVGADASQTGSGILFGNPHFPWQGQLRFYVFRVSLGDEYNVMGAALGGLPIPVIGFNENVAWSHTVSTGSRFTFYELTLNPDNLMQYEYDGEMRDITAQTVSAEQVAADGSVETVEYTFYLSHFGPIIDLGAVSPLLSGWPNAAGTLVTYRDANLENLRGMEQWRNMGQARDLGEFKTALADLGIPWVNTIAADRNGDAFYGDISVVPNVSVAQYSNCVRGFLQEQLTAAGNLTLDGSDSACEWGNDPDTPEGIFGYDSLPKLETREYGANANDSYWLSNPRNLLEGFSPIIGREGVEQSIRTRHTFNMAEDRLAGNDPYGDPLFNIDNIRDLSYQATNHAAELVLDDVVAICDETADWSPYSANPGQATQACEVLGDWDGAHQLDSVGGHVFYEFWLRVRSEPTLWSMPFDVTMPVTTPSMLNTDPVNAEAVRVALGEAVDRLVEAGIPMDRPWGEVQYVEKNGERIGIHGGSGSMMFSVITSSLVDGEGYSNITHGNSYMQAITWDDGSCPDAYAMITYSQSTDPDSDHYADATRLYSEGGWIDMPFCEADRDAQEIRREMLEE
ncbi:penicillin acylase family protein [Pseudohalioglobus sediminis]|uniref:penicillin acylase family protein n=1 Tax=Pseudohalioglobus sediminis TaxID=2606449 RepID=UPI00165F9F1A|nr:penicillin acylase family protein [Pseudohalioglobus sediminis]